MSRCARAPHLAQCPGYPQYEFDSLYGLSGVQEMHETDRVLGGRKQAYTSQWPGMRDFVYREGLSGLFDDVSSKLVWVLVAIFFYNAVFCQKKRRPKGQLRLRNVTVI